MKTSQLASFSILLKLTAVTDLEEKQQIKHRQAKKRSRKKEIKPSKVWRWVTAATLEDCFYYSSSKIIGWRGKAHLFQPDFDACHNQGLEFWCESGLTLVGGKVGNLHFICERLLMNGKGREYAQVLLQSKSPRLQWQLLDSSPARSPRVRIGITDQNSFNFIYFFLLFPSTCMYWNWKKIKRKTSKKIYSVE